MIASKLPSVAVSNGIALSKAVAAAISHVENVAARCGGTVQTAADLRDYFLTAAEYAGKVAPKAEVETQSKLKGKK